MCQLLPVCLLFSCHEKVAEEVREFLGLPEDPAASLKEMMSELQQEMQEQSELEETDIKSAHEKSD